MILKKIKETIAKLSFLRQNLKKILMSKKTIVVLLSMLILFMVLIFLPVNFPWRADVYFEKISYQKYNHIGPDFSFLYNNIYELDQDDDKKYGSDYIAGFKLKSDSRTGCDARTSQTGINFNKNDKEIRDALAGEFSKNVKDFKLLGGEKIEIGNEKAFNFRFSFTDPIGSSTTLSQVIVSRGGSHYILACGTGEYQFKYFEKDFKHFYDSFSWTSRM